MLASFGSRGSNVIRGTLELLILHILSEGPLSGWRVLEQIEKRSSDALRISPGSIYPLLHRLVREKKLTANWRTSELKRRALYYRITADGRRLLRNERLEWERLSTAVSLVLRSTSTE